MTKTPPEAYGEYAAKFPTSFESLVASGCLGLIQFGEQFSRSVPHTTNVGHAVVRLPEAYGVSGPR